MITVFRTMLSALLRDMHTVILTILFPLSLLIALGLYNNSPTYSERLLGGVLALQILFGSSMVTAFNVMAQRNKGIYKLLRITPFRTTSFILAMTASRAVLSLFVSLIMLLTAAILFHVPLSLVSVLKLLLALAIGTIGFTAVGFLAANLSRDENNVNLISNLISFPMLFLSEAFYSLQHAPAWIQSLSDINPFSYFVKAIHAAIGSNHAAFWPPLFVLALSSLLLMALAALTFRWDSERISRRRLN